MGKSRVVQNGKRHVDSILPSDVVVSGQVSEACELLIGVLMPLLQDAHQIGDIAVSAFCSRLVTDLGALRSMVRDMVDDGKIGTDKRDSSGDIDLADEAVFQEFFDDLFRGKAAVNLQ